MRSMFVAALAFGAAASAFAAEKSAFEPVSIPEDPYPSTYKPRAAPPLVIRGATVYDGKGGELAGADVLVIEGRVTAVGAGLKAPSGAREVDAKGRFVTPGIIDMHSHLGVYPSPAVRAHDDGNEATAPSRPEVWAEHSVWPQDPGFSRALAGGVTTLQVLPGSANLFGGRSVTLKNVPARTVQGMKFPGAPYGLKMACGENPKRVYGQKGGPATRMGDMAGYRAEWIKAQDYRRQWDEYAQKAAAFAKDGGKKEKDGKAAEPPKAPDRKLAMDTLADVLRGKILVQMHCYRADEMAFALDLAKEFNYKITAFHHAVEAYKIGDLLAANGTCAAMWSDWWGFKLEAWDTVKENIPLVAKAGACAAIHSDSDVGIQHLNQEVAKALAAGRKAGLTYSKAEAVAWMTLNPAKAMGVDQEVGSLEPGKAGDVVIWSADPFSTYAQADLVFIDGVEVYDRANAARQPVSDFELGTDAAANAGRTAGKITP